MAVVKGTSLIHSPFNSFLFSVIGITIGSIVDYHEASLLCFPFLLYLTLIHPFHKPANRIGYGLIMTIAFLFGSRHLIPTFLFMKIMDQNLFPVNWSPVVRKLEMIVHYLSQMSIDIIYPVFGVNSDAWYNPYVRKFEKNFHDMTTAVVNSLTGVNLFGHVEITYLRPIGLAPNVIEARPTPQLSPTSVIQRYARASNMYRWLLLSAMLVLTISTIGLSMLPPIIAALMLLGFQKRVRVTTTSSGLTLKEGIYAVHSGMLSGLFGNSGIGVVYNSVLHVPYHVCNANVIHMGAMILQPTSVNVEHDLVTYGGASQVIPPKSREAGYRVYVNLESELGRQTYLIDDYVFSDGVLLIPSYTEPGHSGSPILGRPQDSDKLELLGLAGRYLGLELADRVEFVHIEPTDKDENYTRIVRHPGFGKTHKTLPRLVDELMIKHPTKKIFVSGPTRVVCNELYQALSRRYVCSLNIKDSKTRISSAPVQIAAHRTMLKILTSGIFTTGAIGALVIDEAHQDDTATYLLRKYAKWLVGIGISVVEMSATLDDEIDNKSNHPISDIPMNPGEVVSLLTKELGTGKRCLLFVPSLESKIAKEVIEKFASYCPIRLSRLTLAASKPLLEDSERKLIVSTDIAEVGINIRDLDCVFDLRKKFTFIENGGLIQGQTINISRASAVKRRGRIGRSKEGTYYYVDSPYFNLETAAQYDARLLSNMRSWNPEFQETPFTLTDGQYRAWLDSDETPLMIYLKYDQNGLKRKDSDQIRKVFSSIPAKHKFTYEGCSGNLKGHHCSGEYAFLDLRNHDELFV